MTITTDPTTYDLIEVAEGQADYDADAAGKLALQRSGEFVRFVATVAEAAELVAATTGAEVEAQAADSYFGEARWVFAAK